MAGVSWSKLTTQKAAGLSIHLDNDERKKHQHSNTDIDSSRADLNYYEGCQSYKAALQSALKRIKEVDAISPPKRISKDRVTMISLVTYCPEGVPHKAFFDSLNEIYQSLWGADYHGMVCHLDEVHTYYDKKKGGYVKSLAHSHALITPYATWRDTKTVNGISYKEIRKGINGKHFVTKTAMRSLNKAVDEMCMKNWGIHYMTGEKRKGLDTDTIKRDSLRAEIEYLTEYLTGLKQKTNKAKKTSNILIKAINDTLDQLPDPELGRLCLDYLSGHDVDTQKLMDALQEYEKTLGRER